jgi:hypothetical protein
VSADTSRRRAGRGSGLGVLTETSRRALLSVWWLVEAA